MNPIHSAPARLLAVALMSTLALPNIRAATALTPQVGLRPFTPNEQTKYGLTTEVSGGLNTLGIGTPAYLEADVNIAIVPSTISNVTWSIVSAPVGSTAVITNSPLGSNVPVFLPSDKVAYQVAGRALFRPDMAGQYVLSATIGTATNGSTNLTLTLTAGGYMGINTCSLCHSGGVVAEDTETTWKLTGHASIFTQGIDGAFGFYSQSCLQCHTVGYDTNSITFADGGFYAISHQDGWVFPSVLTNNNFANMPANLQNLANIQCENCHGPGSQHAFSLGNTNLISKSVLAGDCEQCHDAPPHHYYGTEWYASSHAITTTIPSGSGRDQCVQCHTAYGFLTKLQNSSSNSTVTSFPPTNTTYAAIGCQTCHEPHGLTVPTNNPHLIRAMTPVTMGDGTVVTSAGEGQLCLQCHHSRNGSAVTNIINYPQGLKTWSGGSSFGPHDGPQGDMIEGINAITYGKTIPSSAHRYTVTNSCVGCHMQLVGTTDPGWLHVGSHTFEMSYTVVTNGVTNKVDQVQACAQCHGQIAAFNFPVEDYDGDGVINGVQTEVQNLLNNLSTLLPNSKGVVDGTVKTSLSVTTNWTAAQLKAAYNWQFVANDGSLGVHNAPFATGILKASISDLTGVSVAGGLPDGWEIQYFGSTTNALGAPNANPSGDGIPNWLKYALGLNPLVAGLSVPNGVVYTDGVSTGGGGTNTLQIYTAAEVTFNAVAGTTYQIQEVSSLGGGWQNIGAPIVATNTATVSYLTPTRHNAQQFFRVTHNP